jgi:hypothetical protein
MPVGHRVRTFMTLVPCLVSAQARSAEPPSAWRLIVGPSLTAHALDATYASTYSPPFQYVPHTSEATQSLPLDGGKGPGVWLGLERALGRHVGLQLSGHYGQADLSGVPGQYALTMRYTSHPPPSYDPVDVTVQRSEAQPAAEGRLKTLALALDVVAWADLGSHGRLGLAAGPAWLHANGRAQSLVYTEYHLGGHSTAFEQDYRVSFEFPASALGLDLGGFAEVDLGRHVGLQLDVRYCWAPEKDAEVSVREIVNPEEIVWTADLTDIQSGLAPAPVPLELSFFRASLALAFRF